MRSAKCEVICEETGRCEACTQLRGSVRKAACRQEMASECSHTSSSSHTPYCTLTPEEKDARLRNIHQFLVITRQRNKVLEARITREIDSQAIRLNSHDETDVTSLMSDVRQMRWHPLVIRFALNLKYLSSSERNYPPPK